MITNLIKLTCAALVLATSSGVVVLAVAMTGLWLMGTAAGDPQGANRTVVAYTGTSR